MQIRQGLYSRSPLVLCGACLVCVIAAKTNLTSESLVATPSVRFLASVNVDAVLTTSRGELAVSSPGARDETLDRTNDIIEVIAVGAECLRTSSLFSRWTETGTRKVTELVGSDECGDTVSLDGSFVQHHSRFS